jgi:hypothetical protein
MRFVLTAALSLLLLPWSTALAQEQPAQQQPAQPQPTQEVLEQRFAELVAWLHEYRHWEAWALKWGNKIAYNAAGGLVKHRPVRPEPPDWLRTDCKELVGAEGKLAEACAILADWDELGPLAHSRAHLGGFAKTDVPVKTSFLQRVHLSGGWVPAQLPAPKVYLVAGMQVGIVEIGRATLPAVGVGLIAMSDGTGGYEWKPATVLGIGYRLATFPFPGIRREAHLHINVARVTIHGVRNIAVGLDPSQNLVGFSLTFSKAR